MNREVMKKVSLAALIAAALIASTGSALAATTAPKPHVSAAAGAEGTASHEMSESSGTQQAEGAATTTKKATKKAAKAKKATKKAAKKAAKK